MKNAKKLGKSIGRTRPKKSSRSNFKTIEEQVCKNQIRRVVGYGKEEPKIILECQ
jgi:hypothetical protein